MKMLEGVRVLDFTTNAAGPIVGSYFADYGAEVIKVEVPGGEAGRRFAYVANGISTYACGKDRGKKSIEMKLSDPAAQKLILEQVKNFDIVLVSNKPGFMEKFGLGYEEMRKVNPGIIYASLTPFGVKPSKYSNKPSYDICAVAMSGINAQTGEADGAPTRIGSVIGDTSGAEGMFASTLLAYIHKLKTGRGQFVDFSLVRNVLHINSSTLQIHNHMGHIQGRSGNHNANLCPYGIYTGKTMSMVIGAVSPATWNALCDCMGHPEYKDDPRFVTMPDRCKHHTLVEQIITDWINTFDDSKEAYDKLDAAGVPCCPVLTPEEAWKDEEYNRLGWWVNFPMYPEWEGTDVASNKHCAYFADFSDVSDEDRRPQLAPRIGENSYEILESWARAKRKQRLCLSSGAQRTSDNFKHADGRHFPPSAI